MAELRVALTKVSHLVITRGERGAQLLRLSSDADRQIASSPSIEASFR